MTTKTGIPIRWHKKDIPLMVMVDPSMSDWEPEVKYAIETWNNVVESEVFIYMGVVDTGQFGKGAAGMVFVQPGDPDVNPTTLLGFTELGYVVHAALLITPDIDSRVRDRVMVHEFGHVLGLEHDPYLPRSVMYPKAYGDGTFEWHVTANDRETLLHWYNPSRSTMGQLMKKSDITVFRSEPHKYDVEVNRLLCLSNRVGVPHVASSYSATCCPSVGLRPYSCNMARLDRLAAGS